MLKDSLTMQDVLHALEHELPTVDAFSIFEWYCRTYRVDVGDKVPNTICWEVFGL